MWLLFLLFTKHLIFDFLYQPPYQWQNKGTYGHLGGLVHAGQHGIATLVILLALGKASLGIALLIVLGECLIHYHMDWFKMWHNKRKGWACNTHPEFWYLTGIDQWVHSLTYLVIAALV